jgi:hypothetical protein
MTSEETYGRDRKTEHHRDDGDPHDNLDELLVSHTDLLF